MELTLYPGNSRNQLEFFTDYLTLQNKEFEISGSELGNVITVSTETLSHELLAIHSCRFILEFYLKEAVLSKIYDEYPFFNTDDASHILSELSDLVVSSPVKDGILKFLNDNKSFNPESYVIFNIKSIMLCIYALTDNIAHKLIYTREKERLISVVRMFSHLSFNTCMTADVEFSSDTDCTVSIDTQSPVELHSDELLAFLARNSPKTVNIKNPSVSPELAEVIYEIFKK